jgi:hypothetical protein
VLIIPTANRPDFEGHVVSINRNYRRNIEENGEGGHILLMEKKERWRYNR